MNLKHIALSLAGGVASLLLAASPASAQCNVAYSHSALTSRFQGPFTTYLDLNAEGVTERSADIVVNGVGCFTAGSTLEISFNAVMSVPTAANFAAGQGTYWDFNDNSGALNINGVSVVQPLSSNGYVTKILIAINSGTLDPSGELLLKNLRFDVTGTTGTKFAQVPDGGFLNAYVDTTNPPTAAAPFIVGAVLKTVASASVTDIGWGFEDGICPFTHCPYPNKGGTGPGYLLHNATWQMTTNPKWTFDFPFRYVGEGYTTTPNVMDPNYIGQTDLVVDVEDIPTGVTVTPPQNLYICSSGTESSTLVQWTQSSQSSNPATGGLVTIYKTVYTSGTQGTLTVVTGMAPSTTGCPVQNTIGVVVGNPSGNNPDGNMQVDLRVVMGPGIGTATFAGDDISATAIPRYLNNITASNPTREIIGDTYGSPVQYFFLNPTQTVLLYPYVTNLDGWNTGIEIGNTGNDSSVFGNTGQNGALDFYFFPSNSPSFEYTAKAGVGRGLDANGNLDAGADFADTVNDLLAHAGHAGNFDGYVIVVAHFNFGHGTGMIFDAAGNISAIPALVLGGHCSYNWNNAQPLITGAPSWPACSSARQGDITKLPEQLKN